MKKNKYIILDSTTSAPLGGLVIISQTPANTTMCVNLYGIKFMCPSLVLDDGVSTREFSISPTMSEIDLDPALQFASDFVVGIFDSNNNLVAQGSTFGFETPQQIEHIKLAKQNPSQLQHFGELIKQVLNAKEGSLVLNKNAESEPKTTGPVSKPTFLSETLLLLFDLFAVGTPDKMLSKIIPNSKWVKVVLPNQIVAVGITFDSAEIVSVGLAYPALSKQQKPSQADGYFTFVPLRPENQNGFGYFVVLQSAKTGGVISIK